MGMVPVEDGEDATPWRYFEALARSALPNPHPTLLRRRHEESPSRWRAAKPGWFQNQCPLSPPATTFYHGSLQIEWDNL